MSTSSSSSSTDSSEYHQQSEEEERIPMIESFKEFYELGTASKYKLRRYIHRNGYRQPEQYDVEEQYEFMKYVYEYNERVGGYRACKCSGTFMGYSGSKTYNKHITTFMHRAHIITEYNNIKRHMAEFMGMLYLADDMYRSAVESIRTVYEEYQNRNSYLSLLPLEIINIIIKKHNERKYYEGDTQFGLYRRLALDIKNNKINDYFKYTSSNN